MLAAAAGDHWFDAAASQQPAVFVVVVAAIGEQQVGLLARPARLAGDWSGVEVVEQWQ